MRRVEQSFQLAISIFVSALSALEDTSCESLGVQAESQGSVVCSPAARFFTGCSKYTSDPVELVLCFSIFTLLKLSSCLMWSIQYPGASGGTHRLAADVPGLPILCPDHLLWG